MRYARLTGALLCLLAPLCLQAQFKLLRFNEDYTTLHNDSSRTVKFMPLTSTKRTFLSLGGEARYEYVATVNEDWSKEGESTDQYMLQRYLLHADLHLGKRVRLFAQLSGAFQLWGHNEPGPLNEDRLNIQNLFVDVTVWQQSLTFRLGRQEMDYGTGRLISVREGTNVRKYFTGAKIMYTSPTFGIDGFIMMDDRVNEGAFDNKATGNANLWGLYSYIIVPAAGNIDFYYLGTHRSQATFEQGTGKETRHTLATRYWKYGGGFIYNLEAAYQFGRFGTANINAWTLAIDIGYTFESLKWKPSVNLRNDYISGDRNPAGAQLQTFNPLYPKGGYFGFNPRVGPANLTDLHPYATVQCSEQLLLQADVVFNWRYSANDGIYRPSGSFNLPGSGSGKKYIGEAYLLSADYSFNPFIKLSGGAQYFRTGAFIRDVVPSPANSCFFNTQLTLKF